jgi:ferredoxin-type protein NapH
MDRSVSKTSPEKPRQGFSPVAAFLLTAWIAVESHLFIVSRAAPGLARVAAWIYFALVVILFGLLAHTGKVAKYRRVFLIGFSMLFAPTFIALLMETRGSMQLGLAQIATAETPFCHIVIPIAAIPYALTGKLIFPARLMGHFASVYAMLAIWATATLTIGRGWCSWVCFFGGWDSCAASLRKRPLLSLASPDERWRSFSYAMLAFVVLASLSAMVSVYCAWFCPFKLVTEFSAIHNLREYLATILFIVIFFGAALVLPYLTKKRVQCASFCPFGAFQSLVGVASLYRVRTDPERCRRCLRCAHECPTLSRREADMRAGKLDPLLSCTRCGGCIELCPERAIEYQLVGTFPGQVSLLARACSRMAQGSSLAARLLSPVLRVVAELLSPRALFIVSGYTLGMIVSSGFGTGTIHRILNLLVNRSFLLH